MGIFFCQHLVNLQYKLERVNLTNRFILMSRIIILFLLFPLLSEGQQLSQQFNFFAIPTQSAGYARMSCRQTSQELDGVYYNPAGLTSLEDGFHIALHNQSQMVDNQMISHYEYLNEVPTIYPSKIKNFVFPTLYLAWKRDRWAISSAVYPAIGGGGSTAFTTLPSGDFPIADLAGVLGIIFNKDVDYEFAFKSKGFGYNPAFQIGFTHKFNNAISVYGGLRFVYSIIQAEGFAKELNLYFKDGSTPNELENTVFDLVSGLVNTEIDAVQKGYGVTPIFGFQYNHKDKFWASMKYEFKTPIDLITSVEKGKGGALIPGTNGVFVNKKRVGGDLPGFYSIGFRYKPTKDLALSVGQRLFNYKRNNWNGREEFVKSVYTESEFGIEYSVGSRWKVSSGYSYAHMNVADGYQNEVNYYMPSNTFTFGASFQMSRTVTLEAGLLRTFYKPQTYIQQYEIFGGQISSALKPIGNLLNTDIKLPVNEVKNEVSGGVWVFAWSATLKLDKKNKEVNQFEQ